MGRGGAEGAWPVQASVAGEPGLRPSAIDSEALASGTPVPGAAPVPLAMISIPSSYTVRLSLVGSSLVRQLVSYTHYRAELPERGFFETAYSAIVRAARRRELESLLEETLLVAKGDDVTAIGVDLTNLQFIGACLEEPPFRLGYEPETLAMIEHFLPRDGTFFDVGSNWGYFSLHTLLDATFHGNVVAFEPVSRSFRDLVRLRDMLGFKDRLEVWNIAAGGKEEFLPISDDAWSGNQSVGGRLRHGELVRVKPLDSLGLAVPHLMKLDVENFEAPALCGASETIARYRPVIIFENWFGPADESALQPFQLLVKHQYRFFLPKFVTSQEASAKMPFEVRGELRLTPIAPEERQLFDPRINVLALPDGL